MDWKGIAEKVVVTVIAGILLACLGWLYTTITAPRPNPLTVVYRWVDLPNLLYGMDRTRAEALDRALADALGVKGVASLLRYLGYQHTGRLVTMRFQNYENYRSKAIEVTVKEGAIFSSTNLDATNSISSHITIAPLDPGTKAVAYIVMPPWLDFEKPPITVLYDGKLVDVTDAQLPEDADGVVYFIIEYPFVLVAIFLIGLITCVIFPIAVFSQLAFGRRLLKFSAKHATKEQVKKYVDFIEAVRKYNPKSMPGAEGKDDSA